MHEYVYHASTSLILKFKCTHGYHTSNFGSSHLQIKGALSKSAAHSVLGLSNPWQSDVHTDPLAVEVSLQHSISIIHNSKRVEEIDSCCVHNTLDINAILRAMPGAHLVPSKGVDRLVPRCICGDKRTA
jgi:hypothetical protein